MAKIDEELAALPADRREAVEARAGTLRDAVVAAHGDLAAGLPDPAAFWEILRIACLDSSHDGEAMGDAEDMLGGMGDRFDVQAMTGADEMACVAAREAEAVARRLVAAVAAQREAGLSLTPEASVPRLGR